MADEEIEYISVVQAVKLISRTFEGNPKHLREFCEGVEAARQVVHPLHQPLLLKFIESKIAGENEVTVGDSYPLPNIQDILDKLGRARYFTALDCATEGVKPDDRKIEAVVKFPIPQSRKDVKSFLGLAGYYHKFIADLSAIARPLTNLLKKENEWNWTEKEQTSFDLLKFKLTSTPLLQYPDFSKPFVLTTDASGYAIGAILSQGKLGQYKPIAYARRTLNKAELNYATVEKELLAIVWACKHFRPYLLGRKFQIVTDHKRLTWIFNVKDTSSRLMRWKLLLEEYDYEIQHRAGHRNCNADSLSPYPIQCFNVNIEEITNERKQKIIAEKHICPVDGHQDIQRTTERIRLYISWPGLEQDVIQYIRECKTCQLNKETRPNIKLSLTVTDTRNIPSDKVYLDIVGPLPTTETGMKYIVTCQDNLSKYFMAIPLQNQTADEVTNAFVKNIILNYGIPQMQTCQQLAKERLIKFKESQGQKVKSNSYEFMENDLALLRIENRQKLDPLWKGPYEIKKIQGSNAVIQELGKRRHQEIHINRLKPYFFIQFQRMQTLKWTLIITLIIWWKLLQAQNIEEVQSETGIYFDEVGTLHPLVGVSTLSW
ncbi:hypothetical protein B7P43_G03694 [Cryptotermes secundus]|uniref:RNA-directed DNA polymerase n=1 Tax=Cryptotermes secundus TaxID=105785 RepID=A0A2J7PKT6_9NEOP|nr:hypothetical protein B7P43_G03694 [Cryptotermes secundus]